MDPARLQQIPLFAELDEKATSFVAAIATERSVPEGEDLMREGDYSYDLLAIRDGRARVHCDGETVAELGPGDIVGEMGVLEGAQRTASVTAATPMELVMLTHWDIDKLRKRAPAAYRQLEQVLKSRRGGGRGAVR